jgi:DNA-binding CsgD family transcriptional regulator
VPVLKHPALVWILVAVQTLCGAYFLWEILASILGLPTLPLRWQMRELVEIGASLGLILGAVLGIQLARVASREMKRAENARRLTSGEFTSAVDEYFQTLDLTAAETEVAWFLLKGQSIAEIGQLRNTREGTVKAQCTAIYRKAGVSGKSQLFSLIVEDVLL